MFDATFYSLLEKGETLVRFQSQYRLSTKEHLCLILEVVSDKPNSVRMRVFMLDRFQSKAVDCGSDTQNKSQQHNKLFSIDKEDLEFFSWAKPTNSALMLIQKMHVPYKCSREIKNGT